MGSNIVEARSVSKRFRNVQALSGVTLEIEEGSSVAILGPNGAGKTTFIEILVGLTRPDSGTVQVLGTDVIRSPRGPQLEDIGVQLQDARLFPQVTVREILGLFRSFYSKKIDVDQLISEMRLESQLNKKLVNLSGGWRQRVRLALALINEPRLIVLDEPSVGLDPIARRELWETLAKVRQRTQTLVVTTHYMEEARELAETIVVMAEGRIIAMGTTEDLIDGAGNGAKDLESAYVSYVRQAELRA